MALLATRRSSLLGSSFVLAPERYDSRRALLSASESIPLGEIVSVVRRTVQPSDRVGQCLILDTSDAREGFVICRKSQTMDIGSTKKALQPGDVIVSRLRPYLRQVAYVDHAIPNSEGATLLCSTEFYVLRDPNGQSVAFLVPFLLSKQVQDVLAASQEGGHHPRFDDTTLLALPVPMGLIANRKITSAAIEKAAKLYRQAETLIDNAVALSERSL